MQDKHIPRPSTDNLPQAVGVIVFTVLALSLGDALIKFASADFVIWQIFVLRSVLVVAVLLAFMGFFRPHSLVFPNHLGWVVLRSLMLVVMWVAYYMSLPHLELSVAAAAYYTLPIFITLLSAGFTRENIPATGWIAVILGFVGVLLIVHPNAEDFNWFALLPLLSALLYALSMILTRTKCRDEDPVVLSVALNVAFIVVGLVASLLLMALPAEARDGFLLAPWTNLGPTEWVAMGLLACAILIGSLGAAIAYQNGPPSVIGTFDFAYVGFAVVWGYVVFGEVPDAPTILGILLIVVAGALSLKK